MSPNQPKIKLITKNNKNIRLHFLQLTTFVNQTHPLLWYCEKKTKPTKGSNIPKSRKLVFENWLFQERAFEENKTIIKGKLYFNR